MSPMIEHLHKQHSKAPLVPVKGEIQLPIVKNKSFGHHSKALNDEKSNVLF